MTPHDLEKMVGDPTFVIGDPEQLVCDPTDSVGDRIHWVARLPARGTAMGHAGARKQVKMVHIPRA